MWDIVSWIVIFAVIAAAVAAGAVFLKAYMSGESPSAVFFKPRAEPRLSVVEYANVDGKRKLVLIRRDDVEHLIMTGGPVDVVVETSIGGGDAVRRQPENFRDSATFKDATAPSNSPAVFSRPPRTFGQATPTQAPATTVGEVEAALKL